LTLPPHLFIGNRLEHLINSIHGPAHPENNQRTHFEMEWQKIVSEICDQAEAEVRQAQLEVESTPDTSGHPKLYVPGR
jgi:hypothetical protein